MRISYGTIGSRLRAVAIAGLMSGLAPGGAWAASFLPESGTAWVYAAEFEGSSHSVYADPTASFDIESSYASSARMWSTVGSARIDVSGEATDGNNEEGAWASYSLDLTLDETSPVRWLGSMYGGKPYNDSPDYEVWLYLESIDADGNVVSEISRYEYAVTANLFDETQVLAAGRYRLTAWAFADELGNIETYGFESSIRIVPEPATGLLVLAALAFAAMPRSGSRRRAA